jgi:hypothetical protein
MAMPYLSDSNVVNFKKCLARLGVFVARLLEAATNDASLRVRSR